MRSDNEMIDVGRAMQCSIVGLLHGKPFPVQFRRQGAIDAWQGAVGGSAIWTRWVQPHATCGDIMRELLWQLEQEWPLAGWPTSVTAPVTANRNILAAAVSANLKYHLNKGVVIDATPALETLLSHSDVDLSVPMSMVGLPYASQYLRFGPAASGSLKVPGSSDRDVVFDGVFCFATPSAAGDGYMLELLFICKRHDCVNGHVLVLGITDRDDTTVAAWLDRALGPEANHSAEGYPHPIYAAVSYVVKLFLYMGLKQARVVEHRDHDIAVRRLAGLGERKRAKLAQRTGALYNGIVVGPERLPTGAGSHGTGGGVAPHWRRGHFRMQPCGPRNLDRKLIFVAPVLIHADRLAGETPAPRSYRARADRRVAA
ncbi:hypothetical protein [Massilia sp. S19_KUP03_FR1]|uniref:hypothetical protein n=1 Tax=Massilia sp. S19_KUP03_FR1 TaxID=3025503 RepID=UPI002FCDDB47